MLRILNLEELSEIQLSLNHIQKQVTFGGSILLALIILCFFIAYLYRKPHAKISKGNHTEMPEFFTTQQIVYTTTMKLPELLKVNEVELTPKTTVDTPKGETKGIHTNIALPEVLKHQTRRLDTY